MRAVPKGYTTVTPWIVSPDTTRLAEFIERAFGAEQLALLRGEDGAVGHAEFRIGDALVMAFDSRDDWPATPAFLRLYVDDADAVQQRAVESGAEAITQVTDLFFGERVGRVRDPQGNVWWIQQRVEELDPDEVGRRAADPQFGDAMAYVENSLDEAMRS